MLDPQVTIGIIGFYTSNGPTPAYNGLKGSTSEVTSDPLTWTTSGEANLWDAEITDVSENTMVTYMVT